MMTKWHKKGFTLIELLLVVVVIGAIILYSSISLRATSQDKTIDQTKVEIENWLQALSSYYIKFNRWPNNIEELTDSHYINKEAQCSDWPGPSSLSFCKNKSTYELYCPSKPCRATTNQYLGISIDLPSEDIVNELAGLLPSTTISGNTLTALTPIPGIISTRSAQLTKDWGWITSAGALHATHDSCRTDYNAARILMPKCPAGYEGHYIQFYLKQRTGRLYSRRVAPVNLCGLNPFNKCCVRDNFDHYYVDFGVNSTSGLSDEIPWIRAKVKSTQSNGRNVYQFNSYITFCIPNNTWFPGGARGANEKQCMGNWSSYNSGSDNRCASGTGSPDYR